MNQVLILTRNNLELTKRCVRSVKTQDIDVRINVIDNASTDGTQDWLRQQNTWLRLNDENDGVSRSWNMGLDRIFREAQGTRTVNYVLVINNDTVLPAYFYRHLLSYNLPFVTGLSVNRMIEIETPPPLGIAPMLHPDFSAFLIRSDVWHTIGFFDETMKHYASDLDWHIRAHRMGIELVNSGTPFYHEISSTIRRAVPAERRVIERQADIDRAVFFRKWMVKCWSQEYFDLFTPETFGIHKSAEQEQLRSDTNLV